jgi:phospholipid N-methyltransferase
MGSKFNEGVNAFLEITEERGDFTSGVISLLKKMEEDDIITINESQEFVSELAKFLSSTKQLHFNSFMKGVQLSDKNVTKYESTK